MDTVIGRYGQVQVLVGDVMYVCGHAFTISYVWAWACPCSSATIRP